MQCINQEDHNPQQEEREKEISEVRISSRGRIIRNTSENVGFQAHSSII